MLSSFSFSEDTVGFLIEGNFDENLVDNLHQKILEKLNTYNTINLYLEDSNIESFSINAVMNNIMFKTEYNSKINKIALVSNRKWIHLCAKIENTFLQTNIKSFSSEDRINAITWIANKK
jgi:hypothetical protein